MTFILPSHCELKALMHTKQTEYFNYFHEGKISVKNDSPYKWSTLHFIIIFNYFCPFKTKKKLIIRIKFFIIYCTLCLIKICRRQYRALLLTTIKRAEKGYVTFFFYTKF